MENNNNISNDKLIFLKDEIIRWGKDNYSFYPWRSTDNSWHALIAEIMLQRTRADQVLPVYLSFCDKYKTPGDYIQGNDGSIFKHLGLLWREKELIKLAVKLVNGTVPVEKESLIQLPGVGDYIASAYRSLHLGIYDIIIDSNVVRLYGRYFGIQTDKETRRKKWIKDLASRITPKKEFKEYNYGLIDFTRKVCKSSAQCMDCPLKTKCLAVKI